MQGEAPVMSGATAAVTRAWPVVAVDRDLVAAYETALAGLDVSQVREVVGSLASRGGPPPSPGILRTVVQSRQAAPRVSGTTSDRRPSVALTRSVAWSPPPPETAAVRGALGPMVIAGAAAVGAALAARQTWATLSLGGRDLGTWPGTGIDGGDLLWKSLLLTLAVLAIGAFYIRRRRSTAHLRGVFGLLGFVALVGVYGCIRGFSQVSTAQDEIQGGFRDGFQDRFGTALPRGAEGVLTFSAGPALWVALVLSVVAAAAALYGLVTVRGG